MSKIQDALDKIKAEREHFPGADYSHASLHDRSLSGRDDAGWVDDHQLVEGISNMHQPAEITSGEKAILKIISAEMPDRKVFNAFRDLRTTVLQRVQGSSPIIMVTSCIPNGGGSFVALNLASAIAMDEAKTSLLVDCNLDDPDFSALPVADSPTGLKEYLRDTSIEVKDIIYPTGISRLRVIPAGLANVASGEFFTSMRLRKLFDDIKKRYQQRYIIVDAPSISDSADARILAQVCDYVVLVVPYSKVSQEQVLSSARAIGKDKLLGTVFNNVNRFPRMAWR
jgi:Mrp family chromosome partitioning ATPase